jgi:hypothetical protein
MAGAALTKVEEQIERSNAWGQDAINAAKDALSTLSSLDLPNTYPNQYSSGGLPVFTPDMAPFPGALTVDTAPDIVSITIPTKPDKPEIDNIDLGFLYSIALPDIPTVSFPSLDITAPIYNITSPKEWSFEVSSNILITDNPMIQAAITRLTNNINNGGTGLSPSVEAAIFARDLERNEQQLIDSTDKITSLWAKKGFSLPDGDLAHSFSEIQKEYMNKQLDRSREISIKQAELEQSNLFKSIELTISLASQLINMLIQYEELVFKNQEATAKFANEYIDLQIKTYASKVDAYRATAQVHEMLIRGEIAKVDLYKAQIEGQKLIGEINAQTIQSYVEQLKSSAILIDRYKAEVSAMVSELEVEKAKIESNKLQFDIWAKNADVQIAKYAGETDVFKASSQINISVAELQSKQVEAQAQMSLAYAGVSMRSFEIAERSMNLKASIAMEAAKGVASATSSMAAGAMAALSVNASMGYSESMSLEEA